MTHQLFILLQQCKEYPTVYTHSEVHNTDEGFNDTLNPSLPVTSNTAALPSPPLCHEGTMLTQAGRPKRTYHRPKRYIDSPPAAPIPIE